LVKSGSHYRLKSQLSGLVLGVAGSSKEPGARVLQWESLQVADQLWYIQPVRGMVEK
jgi:hypothetical protein